MVKNKSENAIKLMKMVDKLDEIKEEMNEAVEFLLDKEDSNQLDNHYINRIENQVRDLRYILIAAGYEFSQK